MTHAKVWLVLALMLQMPVLIGIVIALIVKTWRLSPERRNLPRARWNEVFGPRLLLAARIIISTTALTLAALKLAP
ncbi:MAG TPA: hypothetical protein VGF12_15790 [Roseateles sp.]|uniref:hypothetical protein n=1 Tax=Roseateles sp. TaxID=1971397 RepID=UPI002EDB4634